MQVKIQNNLHSEQDLTQEIIKQKLLEKIELEILASCKIYYLSLTNQVLLHNEKFEREIVKKIVNNYSNYSIDEIKQRLWRSTNFVLIHDFLEDHEPLINFDEDLLARQFLAEYAVTKRKEQFDTWLYNSACLERKHSSSGFEYSSELHEKFKEEHKKEYKSVSAFKQIIRSLKLLSMEEQRIELYEHFKVFLDGCDGVLGAVEIMLKKINEIDEKLINFFDKKTNFHVPVIKIDSPKYYKSFRINPEYLNLLFSIQSENNNLNSYKFKDDSPFISELNMTVYEFNEKYNGQYSIRQDKEEWRNKFWKVYSNSDVCGCFFAEDDKLTETPYSINKYQFTDIISKQRNESTHF